MNPRFDFGTGHALAMAGVKLDPEPLAQPPTREPVPARPCDHGKVPWWDCEECSATSNYSFGGNFR